MTPQYLVTVWVAMALASCTNVLIGGLGQSSDGPSDVDADGDTDGDTDTDSDTDTDGDTDSDTDTDGDMDSDTDVGMDTDTDTDTDADTDTDTDADADSDDSESTDGDTNADTDSAVDSDPPTIVEICELADGYDTLGTVCYVDSVGGSDDNDGLSPEKPRKSQPPVTADCAVVRFKRGSRFNEKLTVRKNMVYTNYGQGTLPQFVVPEEPLSGPVVNAAIYSGVTLDGLYFAGARGDGTQENIPYGVCVFMGASSKVLNCEIASCNIGVMLTKEGSLFKGNYVHDLVFGDEEVPAGVDPNARGGAEGVFINASNTEVSYNTFVNCAGQGDLTCDGGATEVSVGAACDPVSGVKIHHNYSYNNCGFFQVGTVASDCKGVFQDSAIYENLSVDSAWMGFLQVNNTEFSNIRFYNNTNVQRKGSLSAGYLWILYNGVVADWTGGELAPDTVFLTNNYFVFDGVAAVGEPIDPSFTQVTNIVHLAKDGVPGFVNPTGSQPLDFELTPDCRAVNAGTTLAVNKLDFMHRTVPNSGGKTDVGAFEMNSTQASCVPPRSPVPVVLSAK